MARETAAERRARIEKEVADRSAARREAYFDKQEKAKAAAEAKLPPLPEPDSFIYNYAWRQDVGGAGGEYVLTKTPNPYYDPRNNEITDPKTGKKTTMTLSPWSGPTSFRGDGTNQSTQNANKTVVSTVRNADGTTTTTYSDGTTSVFNPAGNYDPYVSKYQGGYGIGSSGNNNTGFTGTGNGDTSTTTYTAPDGRIFTNLADYNAYLDKVKQDQKAEKGKAAFEIFRGFLKQFGIEALAADVEKYKLEGLSDAELLLRLRTESKAYKQRFAANEERIKKGLAALDEATYIALEDKYQEKMRQYGLPASYYARGDMGRQEGFEKFIAEDISPVELEDRIQTAQNRVINANPEVSRALRSFYPDITNGDILAYALDPQKAITDIKRRVTAAEIGGAALGAGLATDLARAEQLRSYGVTKESAEAGYRNISQVLPRTSTLADIYQKQGLGAYTQATGEQEFLNLPGAAEAVTKRRKLSELETAQFSGQAGRGVLGRERAGQF
jgi:hypothetical protein